MALRGDEENLNLICYLLIAAGAIMGFVGFLGSCGAWNQSQCMLITFFLVLIVVSCLEMACAIFAYTHQETIKKYIDNSMYDVVHVQYSRNDDYAQIFDRIQKEFQCCGVKSYRDWLHSSWGKEASSRAEIGIGTSAFGKVPSSCCNAEGLQSYPTTCGVTFDKLELHTYEEFLNTNGCSDALYNSAYNNLQLVISLCVLICCCQILGMFLSVLLCCWVNTRKKAKYEAKA
uniref:Tetraspanin n=1 Tax=Panagrolaimus sp. PS1159 TaxID=55785 RepID=A0AC35GT84_9BILA